MRLPRLDKSVLAMTKSEVLRFHRGNYKNLEVRREDDTQFEETPLRG
jgi:hypothetical protein